MYQEGDRVRTLMASEGMPAGVKGNVVYSDVTGTIVEATVEGMPMQANFHNNQLEVIASHGGIEVARALQGISYAGLNLPEELLEAEGHIRDLIDAGYGYRYMEGYLM